METGKRTGPGVARGSCTRRPGGRGWRGPVGFQGEIRLLSFVAEGPYQASIYLAVPRRWNLTWGIPKKLKEGIPHSLTRMVVTPPAYTRPTGVSPPHPCTLERHCFPSYFCAICSQPPDKYCS